MERVTIVGMGLIGTSLGLALKRAGLSGLEVVGTDQEMKNAATAQRRGAVDRVHRTLLGSLEGARMVVLAVPVMAIRDVMEAIGPHLGAGATVTDTGSTKAQVMQWAEELLPDGVSFVGGHPMAGKEQSGPEAADASLFQGAAYAICPGRGSTEAAAQSVVGLAEAVGARPYFVDAAEHDSYVAAVSHLPFLISTTLVTATAGSQGWREMGRLASSGYRDMSRLASGDPVMHRDICLTNKESIVHWLDEFIKHLYALRNMVRDDPEALERTLIQAWEARARWMSGATSQERPGVEYPTMSDSMMSLFMGERLAKRMKELGGDDKGDKTRYRKG